MEGKNSKHNSTASVSSIAHRSSLLDNGCFDIGAQLTHCLQQSQDHLHQSLSYCADIQKLNPELEMLQGYIHAQKMQTGFKSTTKPGQIEPTGSFLVRSCNPLILTQRF